MAKTEVNDTDFEFIETPKFTQPDFDKLQNYGVSTTQVRFKATSIALQT
jgi:hypothetical protein